MTTHRMSHTPEHNTWLEIKRRCYDEKRRSYATHGARGIGVCKRWLDSFDNFYDDMGPRPSDVHSIERIENDGWYEPNNCRWATATEQALNTRRNVVITAFGKTAPLGAFISAKDNVNLYKKVWRRLRRGWDAERALTAPNDARGGCQWL